MFFDYDAHQTNLKKENDEDVVARMLESFDNETENGKLYISYPMVEALRDFEPGVCGNNDSCYVKLDVVNNYKQISTERSVFSQFNKYDFDIWKEIIDIFAMKVSCLWDDSDVMEYEQYTQNVSPDSVYELEKKLVHDKGIFVLSAFPEFLVDYFWY